MMRPTGFLRSEKVADLKEQRKAVTAISLFSGAGGMDLGMRMAGFEIRVMIDNDPNCCATLWRNFTKDGWRSVKAQRGRPPKWLQKREPTILCRDICTLPTAEILAAADLQIGEAAIVTGGFPCQGFSLSGKRIVNDPRNSLYKQCVRVVAEALPRAFIFENVPGLVSMAHGKIIDAICREFAEAGYDVLWQILNAKDYGVPQDRPRVFFVGTRNDALVLTEEGTVQLHMGVCGRYKHPREFEKRYGFRSHWPKIMEAA